MERVTYTIVIDVNLSWCRTDEDRLSAIQDALVTKLSNEGVMEVHYSAVPVVPGGS